MQNKIRTGNVLIAINAQPCKIDNCGKDTYFAIPLQFAILPICPDHLFPRLYKGGQERLWGRLGGETYYASKAYMEKLFGQEARSWNEFSPEEQAACPIAESLRSLVQVEPECERHPLSSLTDLLASLNARSIIRAMGGQTYLDKAEKENDEKANKANKDLSH